MPWSLEWACTFMYPRPGAQRGLQGSRHGSSTFDVDSDTAPLIGFAVTLNSLVHAVAANVSWNPACFPFLLP